MLGAAVKRALPRVENRAPYDTRNGTLLLTAAAKVDLEFSTLTFPPSERSAFAQNSYSILFDHEYG